MARRQRRDLLLVAGRDDDGVTGRDVEGLQGDDPEPLFATGLSLTNLRPYAVAGDGQRFLIPMSVDPRGSPPITVLSNWQASLPR